MSTEIPIIIKVDASSGRSEMASLRQAVDATTNSLRAFNTAAGGGGAFSALSRQLAQVSSAHAELKRQTSGDTGISKLSRELNLLSKGAPIAVREIIALSSSFMVSRGTVQLFASALGSVALADFAKSVSTTGNSLLSFRIGIDAVAASSKESGDALSFIRNAATRIGAPLDSATDSFKALYVNMRSLGRPVEEIENVFRGFQTAMTALHISARDQAVSWREISETYSQNAIHTRQAILSLGSHIPGMAANLAAALGVTGEKLHAMFKAGGLPVETWTKVAALLEKQYGAQLPEAFNHSQQQIIAISNEMEKLRQVSFDSGFDSGLTTLLKSARSALDSLGGADSIGRKIGEGFHIAFTSADLLLSKLVSLKEPIVTIGSTLLGFNLAVSVIRLTAGAVALLFTPLGAAAAGAVLLASSWDSLKLTFSGSDKDFNAGAEAIKRLTGGWIDLHGAIKGAIVAWEFGKDLLSGKGVDASRVLATQAGNAFDAGNYGKAAGNSFADSFVEGASTLFGKLDSIMGKHMPGSDMAKSLRDEWTKIYNDSAPTPFHGGGDYSGNAARYSVKDLSLSEALEKTYEKLQPTTAALKAYRDELTQIAQMAGKKDPLGNIIDESALSRLREAARADAFESAFPMASKIQDKLDELRAYSDHAGKFGKTDRDTEREVLREVNALKRKGADISDEEVASLKKIVALEKEIAKGGSDGFTQWANSKKSITEGLNDNIKSSMDSVADGIAKIATTGKGQFHSLGAAIRDELRSIAKDMASNFIKTGIRSLMSDAIKGLDLGGMKGKIADAIKGGDKIIGDANDKLDKLSSDALKNVAEANITAGVVNLNGASLSGASGLAAFSPAGANPAAVGGSSNGSLGSIGANSVGEFGRLIDTQSKPLGSGLDLQNKALSIASSMLDKHEVKNNSDVNSFLRKGGVDIDAAQTAWCAGFVNSSLKQVGIKGDGSLTANMFKQWGKPVNLDDLRAGDVVVEDKGHGFGKGGHVGFATGETRMGARGLEIERLSGNHSDRVEKDWIRSDLIQARRATQRIDGRSLDNEDTARQIRAASIKIPDETGRESAIERQMREQREKERNRSSSDSSADIGRQSQSTANDLAGLGTSIAKLGASGKATAPAVVNVAESVLKLLSNLASSGGGEGGGSGGGLGSIVSAGASLLGSFFQEGGVVGSAVSSTTMPASYWAGAPHYAEGTPNTSGGHPAVIHDNEAIIPLSRGREIPVELKGADHGGGDTHYHNHVAVNVATKDADSFRLSRGQVASAMHQEVARMAARNN